MNHVFTATGKIPPARTDAPTACVLCSQNCGLRMDVEDNRLTKIRADPDNPFSAGYSCNKAYRLGHYVNHEQRLSEPLKRQPDGQYEGISSEQALAEIGTKLRRIHDKHGPDSLAFVGLGGQGNHMSMLYALAFLTGFGTRWWFNALAQEKTQRALLDGWMMDSACDVMLVGHIEESDYALLLGSNPSVSQRGVAPNQMLREFRNSSERTLVVVDPRKTETARKADLHLAITVGMDVFLLLGIAAVIVSEQLYDKTFVREKTKDFSSIAAKLQGIDPDKMALRCGIAPEVLRSVAQDFAAAKRGCIELDLGLEQSRFNTLTAYLIRLLLALTNNLGRQGGAVFVGACGPRIRLTTKPKFAPVSGIPGIAMFVPIPMYSPNLFAEEVLSENPARIRAVIVEGSNPMLQYADTARTRAAFEALELSVVIEPTSTETTRVADYVLPTPVGYEKWEVSNFPKPFPLLGLQVRPPLVAGPEGALPEAEIYHRMVLAMGLVTKAPRILTYLAKKAERPWWAMAYVGAMFPLALLKARSIKRSIAMMMFWLYETIGPTLAAPQLAAVWLVCQGMAWTRRADIAREWPEIARLRNPMAIGNRLFRKTLEHPEGVTLARVDSTRSLEDNLGYADGRIRLAPSAMLDEIKRALADQVKPNPDYPFILNGGMRTPWTANVNFRDPAWRKGRGPHCALRLNTQDATALGITAGDLVRVSSSTGAVELPAQPEDHVQRGHIHIPNGFGTRYPDPETGELKTAGVCINELTDTQDRDPFTGCPHFKYVRCRVERLVAEGPTPPI